MSTNDICDFCSDPEPVAEFQADDFVLDKGKPELVSRGGWFACALCSHFIETNNWPLLEARAIYKLVKENPDLPVSHISTCVKTSQIRFRQHMRLDT
jgi:hypothetical protein